MLDVYYFHRSWRRHHWASAAPICGQGAKLGAPHRAGQPCKGIGAPCACPVELPQHDCRALCHALATVLDVRNALAIQATGSAGAGQGGKRRGRPVPRRPFSFPALGPGAGRA